MGAEQSQAIVVDFEEVTQNRTLTPWEDLKKNRCYQLMINEPRRGTVYIKPALPYMKKIFDSFSHPIDILEVGSGNGFNTNIIAKLKNINSLTASDVVVYEKSYYDVKNMLSHDAVKAYPGNIDMLLMVSPPPEGFMDYYAIKEYELKLQKNPKYLMILGELGASDGTDGIYQYLISGTQSDWSLISKHDFSKKTDIFGGDCTKSVYFFKLN